MPPHGRGPIRGDPGERKGGAPDIGDEGERALGSLAGGLTSIPTPRIIYFGAGPRTFLPAG